MPYCAPNLIFDPGLHQPVPSVLCSYYMTTSLQWWKQGSEIGWPFFEDDDFCRLLLPSHQNVQ